MRRVFLLMLVVLAGCAGTSWGQTHPFSIHDMLAMDRISDPQVSPDGEWVVFVLRKTAVEAD